MEETCYVCNIKSPYYQQNLTKIESKNTETPVSELIKRLSRDFESNRNVDDESNCICGDCLQKVYLYDWACMEAAKREKILIKLLSATETSLSESACHTAPVAMEESHDLTDGGEIEIKTEEPELMENEDIMMDEALNTNDTTVANEASQQQIEPAMARTISIQKGGKLLKLTILKKFNDVESMNSVLSKLHDEKLKAIESVTSQTIDQTGVKPEKKVLGPKFAKPIPPKKKTPSIELQSRRKEVLSLPQVVAENDAFVVVDTQTQVEQQVEPPVINEPNEVQSVEVIPLEITAVESIAPGVDKATKPTEAPVRECEICQNGATYSEHGYRLHCKKRHKLICEVCDRKFKSKRAKLLHMEWYESNPGFVCRICRYKSEDKPSYKQHLELHKGRSRLECVFCDKKAGEKRRLHRHTQRVHCRTGTSTDGECLCELCGRKMSSNYNLQLHLESFHYEGKPAKCPKCSKVFKCELYLQNHLKRHIFTKRSFACSTCDMKFRHPRYLKVHEKRHTADTKTVKCSFCPAAYEHRFHLNDHLKRKHSAEIPRGQLSDMEWNSEQ